MSVNQPKKKKEKKITLERDVLFIRSVAILFLFQCIWAINMQHAPKRAQKIKMTLANTLFFQEQEVPFDLILFILVFM